MANLLMLSLVAVVLVSASQAASVLHSPELNSNSVSASSSKDQWPEKFLSVRLAPDGDNHVIYDDGSVKDDGYMIYNDGDDNNSIIHEILDETADDLIDDKKVEEELTEEEKSVGNHIEFPLSEMDDDELKMYLSLEERIFFAEADEHVAFQLLKDKRSRNIKSPANHLRRKRIVPILARAVFSVARRLARRFARSGITRSGSRVTRHYNGRGSYGDAVRDFNSLKPSNVRSFSNGRISGQTGTMGLHFNSLKTSNVRSFSNGSISGQTGNMGLHRVTVRDGSSGNSRPTLEIRSHREDLVRKFRYNGN